MVVVDVGPKRIVHDAGIARHAAVIPVRRDPHAVTRRDLSRYPWIDFDWPATPSPGDGRPSLDALLEGLGETVPTRVRTVLRAGTAGLLVMADGPYLAWLSLTFLDRLPGGFLQPLPVRFGRFRYPDFANSA